MQTFLPYPDFTQSAQSLDYRRLGKQRVEAKQIFLSLIAMKNEEKYGWKNHPTVKMWYGYEFALLDYMESMILEWTKRGYKNTMNVEELRQIAKLYCSSDAKPNWVNLKEFHLSHKSNLIRKFPEFYIDKFGTKIPDNLPYLWAISDKWNSTGENK